LEPVARVHGGLEELCHREVRYVSGEKTIDVDKLGTGENLLHGWNIVLGVVGACA